MTDRSWQPEWLDDLDLLRWEPRPVFARPSGFASFGSESYIVEPYKVRSPHRIHVGDNVAIGERAFLSVVETYEGVEYDAVLRIGNDVLISSDVFIHCAGSVELGDRVRLSARVHIGDSSRDYEDPRKKATELVIDKPQPVRLEADVGVGTGAIILPGVTIGEGGIVSAGSVVTRDVPPRTVVFGNPARVIRSWDEEVGEWVAGPLRRRAADEG